jgi:ribonuclease-3
MPKPKSSHTGKRRKNRSRALNQPPKLSEEVRNRLQDICTYKFKDIGQLDRAFTHSSLVSAGHPEWSNERLEFLGDRVLGLVIASQLLTRFETEREGGLAPRLNALVSRETCTAIARELNLGQFILLDASEKERGGQNKNSILANVVESLIGAIYVDGGLAPAEKFIKKYWKERFLDVQEAPQDPKSALQELVQGQGLAAPGYDNVGRTGPDHAPVFTVEVSVKGQSAIRATGKSKQDAERAAAQKMLEQLGAGV